MSELSTFENASAGFLAAFFSAFTLCPTELVKCQLQAMREVSLNNGQSVRGSYYDIKSDFVCQNN